jgi:ABC-2 type transport system ATP-binding protein
VTNGTEDLAGGRANNQHVAAQGDGAPVLVCRGLRRRYGHRVAVDDVGFQIAPGERYGLLGPNGAGKTTTISMVCGLLRPDAGDIEVAGAHVDQHATRAKAAIGYVPQEIALYPDLTGRENLRFFARLYGLRGARRDERVDACLELVGLVDRADERVDKYSGGMQRRLNIAAGLLHEPRLLVLDEPTVGVDPQSRNAILESVQGLETSGIAVLYTTHYMEEAQRLCNRIGILDEGKLIAEGTRSELVALMGGRDRVLLTADGDLDAIGAALRCVDGVEQVSAPDGVTIELTVHDARQVLPRVFASTTASGTALTGVDVVEPDLEAVFLHLTGKALRD